MDNLKGARLDVVGGGAFGLAVSLAAVWRGADVQLYEPRAIGDNASGIAAGMLAPAFEAGLDPLSADHFGLFRAARDRWTDVSYKLGLPLLDRSGALWAAKAEEAHRIAPLAQALAAKGAVVERLTSQDARRLQPRLAPDIAGAVYTPEDWRLDPLVALRAMAAAFERAGGRIVRHAFAPDVTDRPPDAVVLATGAQSGQWSRQAPMLSLLKPIKGQILHFEAEPSGGPVVRGVSGYIVPQARGAVVGASMEVGVDDVTSDTTVLDDLRAGAAELFPHLAKASAQGYAGVRAATADGLPLVGEVRAGEKRIPRLFLATGARRNGWLLAPLVGETLVRLLAGDRADALGALLSPQRFTEPAKPRQPTTAVPAG